MSDSIGFFDADYYGMFSDEGNLAVAALVERAQAERLTWRETQRELELLSEQPDMGEATDTDVREAVYTKLGFHRTEQSFYG